MSLKESEKKGDLQKRTLGRKEDWMPGSQVGITGETRAI